VQNSALRAAKVTTTFALFPSAVSAISSLPATGQQKQQIRGKEENERQVVQLQCPTTLKKNAC